MNKAGVSCKNNYLVDAYSHVAPLEVISFYEGLWSEYPQRGLVSRIPPLYDPAVRVNLMETQGVDLSILISSLMLEGAPPVWAVPSNAIATAQFYNNFVADNWVSAYPDKFRAVALLPSVTAAAMVDELVRAVTEKGCVGGLIGAGPENKPLDHADYMGPGGLYEKAVELNVPIWVHPSRSAVHPDYVFPGEPTPPAFTPFSLGHIIGWPYDSSVAMARMIFSGVFDMYPDLKIVIHHQGGMFPTWWARIQGMTEFLGGLQFPGAPTISEPLINHAKKFYVDTACPEVQPDVLKLTVDFFGQDHVLFGTDSPLDFPLGSYFVPNALETLHKIHGLSTPNERKVLSENILNLIA